MKVKECKVKAAQNKAHNAILKKKEKKEGRVSGSQRSLTDKA
jgi:hypothetical protein